MNYPNETQLLLSLKNKRKRGAINQYLLLKSVDLSICDQPIEPILKTISDAGYHRTTIWRTKKHIEDMTKTRNKIFGIKK